MRHRKTELNTEQIVVRVTPAVKRRIEEHCEREGISIAEWVRCCAAKLSEPKEVKS